MKKIVIALAAAAAAMLAGCQKPEVEGPVESKDVFTASVEEFDAQTKTSMTENRRIVWSAGDRLSIFQGSTIADEYVLADGSAGLIGGSFKWAGRDNEVNSDFGAGFELPCNVAFYPYAEGLLLDGDMLEDGKKIYTISTVVLPEVQTYVANSFGNGAFPMVAVTQNMDDHNLKFKNIGGALKLQLKGSCVVKSIKVEGKNGEKLSGAATVTAYANNQAPAIKMASDASTFVMLDCVDGVQLNEAEATNFYIALPPVLFEKGFIVTVTDVEEKEYTVSATEANTILRSSILVMPEVTIESEDVENPEEDEEELLIPVMSISLNSNSLDLYQGEMFQLVATVRPTDAYNKTVFWSSSDDRIVTVDQTGLATAITAGYATISAMAGGIICKCTVSVSKLAVAIADYVDEYEISHGKGTVIGGTVWAPVNCGYHAIDYKWGKLYQWGRKYGQGYSGGLYDEDQNLIGYISDATTPEIATGGVSAVGGNHPKNANVFYTGVKSEDSYSDWVYPLNGSLWNVGSESQPVKSEYDPCPTGWRVPTKTEFDELCDYESTWIINSDGQSGFCFMGQVFFCTAGVNVNGVGDERGFSGRYWASGFEKGRTIPGCLVFWGSYSVSTENPILSRAVGHSVRCVQE